MKSATINKVGIGTHKPLVTISNLVAATITLKSLVLLTCHCEAHSAVAIFIIEENRVKPRDLLTSSSLFSFRIRTRDLKTSPSTQEVHNTQFTFSEPCTIFF